MKNKKKFAITVDVESEKLLSNFFPTTTYKYLKKTLFLIEKLESKKLQNIPVTWFIRCDETTNKYFGKYEGFLDMISKFIEKRKKKGDLFGFHPHLYTKVNGKWIFENRENYQKKIIKNSIEGWKKYFGHYPKISRIGESYMNNNIANLLDSFGIKYDLTALPGRKRKDYFFNFDWTLASEKPYRPLKNNYQLTGKKKLRKFVEIPFTMLNIKTYYDKKPYKRYLNLSFKHSILKNGLKKFNNNRKFLIGTFHPFELFKKKKKSIFINKISDFEKNINLIEKKFGELQFVTVDELVK